MNGHRQIQLRRAARRRSLRGFTAVEIAMVAAVIAIIALLVLPVFRSRTEEARKAGALDELASLAKAQLLAEADVNIQIRLQDMDNGKEMSGADADSIPPIAAWNGVLESTAVPTSRTPIVENWQGPYAAYKNSKSVRDLEDYWWQGADGFIYVAGEPPSTEPAYGGGIFENVDADRYPVDPWGGPYAFYGSGKFPASVASESTFNSSILVSFGPNGVVANRDPITVNSSLYRRYNPSNPSEMGLIGWDPANLNLSDDIVYKF